MIKGISRLDANRKLGAASASRVVLHGDAAVDEGLAFAHAETPRRISLDQDVLVRAASDLTFGVVGGQSFEESQVEDVEAPISVSLEACDVEPLKERLDMLSEAGRLNADTAMTAIDALDKVCLARLEAINVQSADKVSLVADKMERDLACARARLALDIARIEEELARIDARLDAVMKPRGVFSAVSGGMDGAASQRRSTSRTSVEERARHAGMF